MMVGIINELKLHMQLVEERSYTREQKYDIYLLSIFWWYKIGRKYSIILVDLMTLAGDSQEEPC